jgi:copper chaperone CopZ
MKASHKKVTNWSQKHIRITAILCCLLNIHFCVPNSIAQSVKAVTGEQSEVTDITNNASASNSANRQVDLQFGGSLCAVCLNAFKIRLLNMPGVKSVEISFDKINPKSGHPPKVAHAFVGYDPEQISVATLVETVKRNDFKFLSAKDKTDNGNSNNNEGHNLKH